MKISTVRLRNFRQFQGESEIHFSDSENQPFTIFYGTNKGGKTTLLAALFFVIQGGDFRFVDPGTHDLNITYFESSANDSELSLSVEIDFEDAGANYTARRERTFRKRGEEELFVKEVFEIKDENGTPIHPPQRWMNSLMPPNLIRFFFFPGEALDTFYNDENVRKLRQDIYTITKIDVLERAAEIAKKSSAEISKHLQNATVEVDLRAALDAHDAAKAAIDSCEVEIRRLSDELGIANGNIAGFEKTLQSNAMARKAISERRSGESKVANADIRIAEIEQKIRDLRANRFYTLFSAQLTERVLQVCALMESGGQIGGNWTPLQLEGLLEHDSQCVCGRDIGPDEKAKIQTQIDRFLTSFPAAPYLELKDAITRGTLGSSALVLELKETRDELQFQELERESGVIQIENTRDIVDGNLARDISEALLGYAEYSDAKADLETQIGELNSRLEIAKIQLLECQSRIESLSSTVASSKNPILHMQYLDRLHAELINEVEEKNLAIRAELLAELKQMLPRLYDMEIEVEIDPDFMPIVNMKFGNLGESTGQKQARALIMMIALNRIANRHAGELREFNIQGSASFPLVIDSAFGQLDSSFRGLIAEELSRESGQNVILVSSQQAKGVVDIIGVNRCGREYLLQIQVPGLGETQQFEIDGGRSLDGKVFGADSLQTRIIEVPK